MLVTYPDMLPASAISSADGGDGNATATPSAASVPAGTYVFWISASDVRVRARAVRGGGSMKRVHIALMAATAAAAASVVAFAPALESSPEQAEVPPADRAPVAKVAQDENSPGQNGTPPAAVPQGSEPAGGPPEPADILRASDIGSPEVLPRTAESVNEFAFDFYRNVSDTDKNVFFSPVSVYTAFSVLYEGARGETAEQMLGVFGFEPDDEERHAASTNMMAALNAEDPHAVLETANALWLADWFEPYEQYLDIARNTYLATVETVNFAGEGKPGVKKVNDWAAEKTRGKIQEVLDGRDINNLTAAVITNAVYFKGTWLIQFPKDATEEDKFWKTEGGGHRRGLYAGRGQL